ncbi:MAG: hypothetical protein OEX02_10525 [Cyclobacteriaceae bacterium]|nr:hypothetical protein [Cyclobacteriaceae bacterium]
METPDDKKLVNICLEELCNKLGLQKTSNLSQSDYEFICYHIEEKTPVNISLSTIKRIFEGKYERLPQLATLDAIAQLAGYTGWQEFKSVKLRENFRQSPTDKTVSKPSKKTKKVNKKMLVPLTLLISMAAILVFYLSYTKSNGNESESVGVSVSVSDKETAPIPEVEFSARKAVDSGLPNTVIFSYNIDHIEADSFFIQQSWDKRRRVKIEKNNYTQTDIYYEPGSYKAKIIANDSVLKEIDVVINSEKWVAFTAVKMQDVPIYYDLSSSAGDSIMRISVDQMKAEGLEPDTNQQIFHFYTNYSDGFKKFRNDFRFKTRIRLNPLNKAPCYIAAINIMASDGMIAVPVINSGCTSQIGLMISDVNVDGKKNDLSSFGIEADQWYDLEIRTENNKASVFINGSLAFEQEYTVPTGFIAGISLASNGLLEVDYVSLSDSMGVAGYHEEFDINIK